MAGTVAASAVTNDAARLRLRLLGEFSLTVDGEERAAALPARAASLLAYLVLRAGTAQPRQRIAQLLWPESTDGQARTNLRNVLHHLRRSAPELTGPFAGRFRASWTALLLEGPPAAPAHRRGHPDIYQ